MICLSHYAIITDLYILPFFFPEITRGDIYFHNNDLLCFHDTILWKDIKFNPNYKVNFKTTNNTDDQYSKNCK